MPPRFADLRERTLDRAVRVITASEALPKKRAATVVANQLVRSGTSVGAHLRESIRARSNAEIVSKLEAALQDLTRRITALSFQFERRWSRLRESSRCARSSTS